MNTRVVALATVSLAIDVAGPLAPAVRAEVAPPPPPVVVATRPSPGDQLEPDDLPAPQLEVVAGAPIDLPAIPAFRLPPSEPGFRSPRELEVHGARLLGSEIKVKGYVTWIYDCDSALAAANPGLNRVQLHQAIDDDPSLCEYPKIYLGDARDTPRSASIWVVDLPRAVTPGERIALERTDPSWPVIAHLAVGDYVSVTGSWRTQSPHAEHDSAGLLVYKAIERAAPATAAADAEPEPQLTAITVATGPAMRKVIDADLRDISVGHLNACNKAIAARRYDTAFAACQASLRAWDANHLAWYALTGAHMARGEWRDAKAAIEQAVALRPDQPMYQLYYGMALYEVARLDAHGALGDLAPARDALRRAAMLAPALWRAHYYLGRVYRDLDQAKLAAEQFTEAVKANPGYRLGYIALVELYRRWGYVDPSLIVATIGALHVAAADAADLWLEIGMAYDAKSADDKAIAALTKAIAIRPDATAKLERGRLYFRRGALADAKRDLQDVIATADPKLAAGKQLAAQMLDQLVRWAAAQQSIPTLCSSKRACRVVAAPSSSWHLEDPLSHM